MALGAENARRLFPAVGGVGEVSAGAAAPVFLAADRDRPVDPRIWGDEKRMKRELVAWAKARGRPCGAASGGAAAPVFLATDKDSRPLDPMIWGDEKRMKRELLAWAKAVASMTVTSKNTASSSSSLSTRRRE
ncbi:hypothetical protein PR202_gb17462 [Eleusine coracana subsp. coracana]|uniref:Uncharacterized protein n=1 Tax=Eleusine coracana subsp. coracana TaxID=191504 RepID=A0AAV5F2T7_ELECO|nr:hypothetical protein PR202_gb17462 [Eleusine coracana subsp. coracana]